MKNIVFILLSFALAGEMEVDGNLKVTGTVDAIGNPITNVGEALSMTDAINGNVWPGETISSLLQLLLIAIDIVCALSAAEIPVLIPSFASIEIVNAVKSFFWFEGFIKGSSSSFILCFVNAKQIKPLPYFALKLIALEVTICAG